MVMVENCVLLTCQTGRDLNLSVRTVTGLSDALSLEKLGQEFASFLEVDLSQFLPLLDLKDGFEGGLSVLAAGSPKFIPFLRDSLRLRTDHMTR